MFNSFIDSILRNLWRSISLAVAVLVVLTGLLWWDLVWQSPQTVFSDMLANNLNATSVTKHEIYTSNGVNINQYARLEMGSTNAAEWLVTAAQSNTSDTTDSIGTPTTGYIRYTQISTVAGVQKKAAGFGNVLNVWGKADGKTDPKLGQLFSATLLDINSAPLPPIGNLSDTVRQVLVDYMQNQGVFSGTYSRVSSGTVNGHGAYTYQLQVHLGPYVRLMQSFAHALGISALNGINPDQFSTAPPVNLTLSVDKISHQLVQVIYPATGFNQSYADWGLLTPISIPQKAISTSALQARIQSIK